LCPGADRGVAADAVPGTFPLPASDDDLPGAGPLRRADWFQQVWTERRTEFARSAPRDAGAVVFLGDSITQGWGDLLTESFPGLQIANRGISGDTTRGMLLRLQEDVLSVNPAAVVLLMGTNDLEEQAAPETIAGNVRLILAALHAHRADLPVVLCLVFPSSAEQRRPADQIQELNRLYQAAAYGDARITVLDTWTLYANPQGDAPPELFPDRLHLNEAGYRRWGAALRPVLATLGFLETEEDDFVPEEGFESLFNGRDLTGWGLRPSSPEDLRVREQWRQRDPQAPPWPVVSEPVSFEGRTTSDDGRYVARHGRLIVTTPSEGRRIQQLYTTRDFPQDFTLRLEFRATPNADSGVFVRKPQLQCRDYLVAGPYKELQEYRPQDWNALEVVVRNNVARCTCNGEVLEAALPLPATGPIGLEGDRGQMEYRRIRIKLEQSGAN
jgi:lysophospholipase L1-like esterase